MNSLCVVEIHTVLNAGPQLRQTDIIFDFETSVFQRPPETLHLGVIPAASAPVHADLNFIFLQFIDKFITGLFRYDDIINLPHHVSPTRQRMSMHDRAAQFVPFAALVGYDDAVAETARLTESRPELDEQEQIVNFDYFCFFRLYFDFRMVY